MKYQARFRGEELLDVDEFPRQLRDCTGYLMLQVRMMRKYGYAAQSIAAALEFVDMRSMTTFASIPKIAKHACLPAITVRRHLAEFESKNRTKNLGRQKPKREARARRTNTWAFSPQYKRDKERYVELPRWAAKCIHRWTDRFVYSAILSRRLGVQNWEEGGGTAEDRLAMSATTIAAVTGRPERVVWRSLESLQSLGFIKRAGLYEGGADRSILTLPRSFAYAILPDDVADCCPPLTE